MIRRFTIIGFLKIIFILSIILTFNSFNNRMNNLMNQKTKIKVVPKSTITESKTILEPTPIVHDIDMVLEADDLSDINYVRIKFEDKLFIISLERLLTLTSLVESDGNKNAKTLSGFKNTKYADDKYTIYGEYQLEKRTVSWLKSLNNKTTKYNLSSDKNVAKYLYLIRLKYEINRLNIKQIKNEVVNVNNNSIYYVIYKSMFNTIDGKATYKRWKQKEKEVNV